jgi:hypothetical protein
MSNELKKIIAVSIITAVSSYYINKWLDNPKTEPNKIEDK